MSQPIPVQQKERLEFVDILRGFALIGVLTANMSSFSGYSLETAAYADTLDKVVLVLIQFLIRAKFYTFFSFLFGWGTAVQLLRAGQKGYRFRSVFARRMVILLVFGLIHGLLIWTGDILFLYAVLGLLLLAFRNRSERTLLVTAVICLIIPIIMALPGATMDAFRSWYETITSFMRHNSIPQPIYGTGSYWEITQRRVQEFWWGQSNFIYVFGVVFAMFLLGLYVGKRRILQNADQHLPLIRRTMLIGLVIGLIFNGLMVWNNLHPAWVAPRYDRLFTVVTRSIGAPALMLFYATAIILLTQREKWLERLRPLAAVGRMALTNYIMQSVLLTLFFYNYGLGLYDKTDPSFGLTVTVLLFVGQIRFSAWWLEKYQFGPLEWLWRTLTYGRRQPLRHGETYHNLKPNALLTRIRRLHPAIPLGASWIILLLWVGALLLWSQSLQAITGRSAFQLAPQATAVPQATPESDQIEAEDEFIIATPQVTAVTHAPENIARSGDMLALAQTFDAESALAQIEILSDESFGGRRAASVGGLAAGDYIAEQFAQLRLQPAGNDGFFQTFPVTYTNLAQTPLLSFTTADGVSHDAALYQDFAPVVRDFVGEGEGGGQVVWLNDCGHEDFGLLDANDKVVLCQTGLSREAIQTASREALEHGANGLLLATNPTERPSDFGDNFWHSWVPEPIPAMRVFPEVVDALFLGSGGAITEALRVDQPLILDAEVEMTVDTRGYDVCPGAGCLARNVLGVLPGRDPEFAHEVVVISAHYDHLGQSPDGTIWYGANDDASGVAAMLEIARNWQEQGYVPRRTVLFAAWDAEELGLLGSSYFVEHPNYPLENIVAVIQMDMVGAGGDILYVDGEENLTNQLHVAGEMLDVPMGRIPLGRSDHVPFLQAGVPAALLIWLDEEGHTPVHYHRPADTPDVIELDKLEAVGRLVEMTTLDLAESKPAILEMLAARATAVSDNNRASFLAASENGQTAVDTHWFNDIQTMNPLTVTMRLDDLQVVGDSAFGDIRIDVRYPAADDPEAIEKTTGQMAAQFARGTSGWQWAGPNLTWLAESGVNVGYPPSVQADLTGVGDWARDQYRQIAGTLGLTQATAVTLELLPDAQTLRASAALSLPDDQTVWVNPGIVKIVTSQGITESVKLTRALTQLALANAGMAEAGAPWLWDGLPLVWEAQADKVGAQMNYLPRLSTALAEGNEIPAVVAAWAATDYLLNEIGWDGLGRFISDLGRSGEEVALRRAMGMDAAEFAQVWQGNWAERLTAVQTNLDIILAARTTAILANDEAAFLRTVNASAPWLDNAQRRWLADFAANPPDSFEQTAQPMALLDDGSALARVTMAYQFPERSSATAQVNILFTPGGDGFLWAGKRLNSLPGNPINVLYPPGETELAQAVQIQATSWYTQLASLLDMTPSDNVQIELYDEPDDLQAAVALSYPSADWAAGWTEPEQAIKLKLTANADWEAELIIQLTRHLLFQSGIEEAWLLDGIGAYLSRSFDGGAAQMALAESWPDLTTAVAEDALLDLLNLPPNEAMSRNEAALGRAQSWDAVRYLVNAHGWEALAALLDYPGDVDAAFTAVIGQSQAEFLAEWADSLARGHIQPAWLDWAQAFDEMAAMADVAALTDESLNGRLAGTIGADRAADYIAAQFRQLGLVPAGEQANSFFQTLPITVSDAIAAPRLEFAVPGDQWLDFIFRNDYLPLRTTAAGAPAAGDLFFMQAAADYASVDFAGGVVVRWPSLPLEDEIRLAVENGVGALVLVGAEREEAVLYGKRPFADLPTAPIPVLELTYAGQNKLLAALDLNRTTVKKLTPIQEMEMEAAAYLAVSAPTAATTTNVLGLLPGSDPTLRHEMIIIGAHYDHVGDDPDGYAYSGANDNASGVAALLAIIRLWQEIGYRPQRSVLFAAWGGQELGNLGSAFYVANPTRPLTNTIALVQLDSIAGGDGFAVGGQGELPDSGLLSVMETAVNQLDGKFIATPEISMSDHFAFADQTFPSILISWRLARENNLPDEFAYDVSPDNLRLSGQAAALLLMSLAQ